MKKAPSILFCFIAPVIILWIGTSVVAVIGYQKIPSFLMQLGGGSFSEGFTVSLSEPGKYVVWCEDSKNGDEGGMNLSTGLPTGGKVFVFDDGSSDELPLLRLLRYERKLDGVQSHSIGTFEITRPDQTVLVKGTGFSGPLAGSVTPDNSADLIRLMLSLLGIVLFTFAIAIAVFIVLLHRRQKLLQAED